MFEFEVALLPSAKDCFVRVPAALAQELLARGSSRVVLRLETDDWRTGTRSSLLVSWEGSVSAGERVEVASGFWGALRAGSRVQLEPVDAPPDCGIVCVEPLTCDDWEMLELNAGHLEEQILNQAFVLSAGQVFPLWIFGKQLVNLAVKSLNCGPCGLLRPDTSFVVEPKPRRSKRPSSASAAAAASQLMRPVTLRVLPAAAAGEERPGYAAAACEDWSDGAVVWVSNPHPPLRRQEGEESVSRLVLRAARDPAVPRGCVRLAAEAMLALQLLPWARVQVFPSLQGPDGGAKSCQLTVMSRKKLDAGPLWEAFMGRSATRVFSHGTLVELAPQLLARLGLKEAEGEFVLGELLKHAERTVTFAAPPPHLAAEAVRPLSPRAEQLVGAEAAARRLAAHVLFYARHPLRLGKLAVVSGGIGSGKSALVRAVCGSVPELYTEIVDCERLVAEKLSAVRGALTDAVLRCHGNFPGCLVLENLHLLCPENDEASLRPQQLAEALVNLLRSGRLVAVAAVPSAELLHPLVRQLAVCGTTVAIEALGRDSRRELARRVAEELQLRAENAVLEYVADATDGFCPGDIRSLLQRIPRDDFSERAVAEAKKLSTPSNLLGIKLHKSKVRFEQIGGLAAAKMTLRETLGYPKTHAKLLKDSPIKLPTGVLLYGPPGSGKTMLASASAQEFGLNAICVSGPELLSKYIGQSEQSVRELFHRAKQCKPSVIVFDEFDSIAPKRGHDSTGVTDRVVNQLLTQLDGVESRQGVFVVAVSSRPDLIDPALLRPGRLDKLVFVGLPDAAERLEILGIVCKSMHLAAEVDLQAIANQAVNFSGADLQALMYNAQLGAVHESLDLRPAAVPVEQLPSAVTVVRADRAPLEEARRSAIESLFAATAAPPSVAVAATEALPALVLRGKHVAKALGELRPSISDQDRRKFEGIYGQFQKSQRGADFKAGLDDASPKQTLM